MKKIIAIAIMLVTMLSAAQAQINFPYDGGEAKVGYTCRGSYQEFDGMNKYYFEAWIDGSKKTTEKHKLHKINNKVMMWELKQISHDFEITCYSLTGVTAKDQPEMTVMLTDETIDKLYEYIGVEGGQQENGKTTEKDGIIMQYINETNGTVQITCWPYYGYKEKWARYIELYLTYFDADGNQVNYEKVKIYNVQSWLYIDNVKQTISKAWGKDSQLEHYLECE